MSHTEIYIYMCVCVYRKPKWITCIAPLWKIIALSMVRLSCVYHYVKLPLVHQPMAWSMMYVDTFIQMYTVEALWVGKTNISPRKYMAHEVYGLEKQQWVIFTTDIFFFIDVGSWPTWGATCWRVVRVFSQLIFSRQQQSIYIKLTHLLLVLYTKQIHDWSI